MNASFAYPERVPVSAVARLQKNLADLLAAMDAIVLAAGPAAPSGSARMQQTTTLLRDEAAALSLEAGLFETNDRQPLLRRAAAFRLLARRMDGCAIASAAEDAAKALIEKRQLVVLTAWQITAAASGSEAAGL